MMKPPRTDYDTVDSFIKDLDPLRRSKKWYAFQGTVNGKHVALKGFELWLQVFRVNGVRHGGDHGCERVRDWKEKIKEVLS